ncbi:hypothetical protein [Natrinema amylolyticum]|uniref:hypothetical protein n=1 Tax=Natrinema amylolyticum TaxID=2878679 RepID=UPI001CFA8F88|nr:hypothetical protein [Natrinema amylolyticum]
MTHQRQSAFTAACRECGIDMEPDSANEIVDFYRRHRRQTDHDVILTRAEFEFDPPTDDDLVTVIADLENRYENGVPIGIVAAAMSERGFSVGETLDEIHEVRMTGALYEPRDDHLATL